MTKVNYEPWRLVSNGKGRNAGNEFAPVDFKMAEAARVQNGKDKRWAAQLAAEAELISAGPRPSAPGAGLSAN